jgi:hypothetical protein
MHHPAPIRTLKAFSFEPEEDLLKPSSQRDSTDEDAKSQDLYSGVASPTGSSNY